MPMTSAMYALGKILGPLVSELEFQAVGMALVFYVLLVLTAALMFGTIAMNRHFQSLDSLLPPVPEEAKDPIKG